MDRKNELLVRVYLVLASFICFSLLIGWKLVDISIINGDKWRAENASNFLKWKPVKAQRGDIYSDDGIRMLASSIEFFEIRMDPVSPSDENFYQNIYKLCVGLENIIGKRSADQWRALIEGARKDYHNAQKKGTRNLLISKKVNDETFRKLKELPLFELGQHKGGFIVNRFFSRKKTYHELASRTIGVHREKNMVGIERSYNNALKGTEREELMRFFPPDLWVPLEKPTDYEVIRGKDVITSINVDIQDIVHNELANGINDIDANAGVAIVMDVKTGYIKSISNLTKGENGLFETINKAVAEMIEPGSTIKAATALALLEEGIQPEEKVRIDKGRKKFYDRTIFDSNYPSDDIIINFEESITKSSNVGIGSLANDQFNSKKGKIKYYNYLRKFQLTEKTGIDLLGEPQPYIKNPENPSTPWSGVTVPYMAHGYELQITPLQTLAFYNAVANDGTYMVPRLVKEIRENEETLKTYKPKSKKQPIASLESVQKLQNMLEGVVNAGTGHNIYSDYYSIAGKTGTAAFNYVDKEKKEYNASFAGYFPADQPKYSMIVVTYGLKGNKYYGSQAAAPIFKRIADKIMILEGGLTQDYANNKNKIFPKSSKGHGGDYSTLFSVLGETEKYKFPRWARIESSGKNTIAQKALIRKKEVPNVKGMGLRDAMYVLENIGMRVEAKGAGKVKKQSIKPGSILSNDKIIIYLN